MLCYIYKGGADVTVKLLCTADLIILPSTGEKTQWVEPVR